MAAKKIDEQLFDVLADVLKKNELTEVEYSEGDTKIKLVKGHTPIGQPMMMHAPSNVPVANPAVSAEPAQPVENTVDPKHFVSSPMVGTAYCAPTPDAANFVSEGDKVSAGQTLLIIEAMKVMNPIKAPHAGTVKKILVQNAQPIEFDEQLMIIEP